ncbi:MAG TPA: ATP-grasp domain-containing protein [Acidimicrobiales bacterium]|nr:ATP-grasp domain-containing protein [Acidimicrobiales bacterium]
MPRVLLLLPTSTYRAPDFVAAATRLGVEVVVGSEHRQALAGPMGDRAVVVPLAHPVAAVDAIAALHERAPLDAVVAVDDQGTVVAAAAAERLGLLHNSPGAVSMTRHKGAMRAVLTAASLPQPAYRMVPPGGDVVAAANAVGYPCVVKPVSRSGSQGVIRANGAREAEAAGVRVRAMLGEDREELVVEQFVPGHEVAVEGLLRGGVLEVLAVFDKPDPLDGPFFEETIYLTPSRHSTNVLADVKASTAAALVALGLNEGPIHAELRLGAGRTVTLIEAAARSIGGMCARALRFGAGMSLEEVILAHALGLGTAGVTRESQASGVMMLPIRSAGVLDQVTGQARALDVEGVAGVEITIAPGRPLVPLPEGDRYLGFIFARGSTPASVEDSLRRAEACLGVRLR